jgi:putative isomerase
LGEKLPVEIRDTMVANLKNGGFITQWGLASESTNSPLYGIDSYWRGPIWAPSTMIVVDGLKACGEHDLAKDIARRFCDLCEAHGFAENFDAKTGQGHRDLGYTWTASVFLVLGHEYLINDK